MLLGGGELDGKRYLSPATFAAMTSDHIGPGSGVEPRLFLFSRRRFLASVTVLASAPIPARRLPPPPGSIGEIKWDGGQRHLFRGRPRQ